MTWGAVSLVDPACITSSIVLASIYGMLGVHSLSHKSKPSKFYALALRPHYIHNHDNTERHDLDLS